MTEREEEESEGGEGKATAGRVDGYSASIESSILGRLTYKSGIDLNDNVYAMFSDKDKEAAMETSEEDKEKEEQGTMEEEEEERKKLEPDGGEGNIATAAAAALASAATKAKVSFFQRAKGIALCISNPETTPQA